MTIVNAQPFSPAPALSTFDAHHSVSAVKKFLLKETLIFPVQKMFHEK